MAVRWVDVALFAILGTLVLNQYPLWGSAIAERIAIANTVGVTYLVLGVGLWVLGGTLHVRRLKQGTTGQDDLPLALVVLGAGMYLSTWLMELVKQGREDLYVTVTALIVGLLILALTISASLARRPRERSFTRA